jgi:hypothetical protein
MNQYGENSEYRKNSEPAPRKIEYSGKVIWVLISE